MCCGCETTACVTGCEHPQADRGWPVHIQRHWPQDRIQGGIGDTLLSLISHTGEENQHVKTALCHQVYGIMSNWREEIPHTVKKTAQFVRGCLRLGSSGETFNHSLLSLGLLYYKDGNL